MSVAGSGVPPGFCVTAIKLLLMATGAPATERVVSPGDGIEGRVDGARIAVQAKVTNLGCRGV